MMKCPKNFDWFGKKRSISEANLESDVNENSQTEFASTTNNVTNTGSSQITDVENTNDENDFVPSSQDTHRSKLRDKINKTLVKKLKTPQASPQKADYSQLLGSPNKKLSFSDVYDLSSTVIKEEIVELLDDMKDFEDIEMTHNLSDLLVDSTISPITLDCASPMGHLVKVELLTDDEDANTGNNQLQDPLQIDEKVEKDNQEPVSTTNKKKTVGNKKLKSLSSIPKRSSKKKKSLVSRVEKKTTIKKNKKKKESKTENHFEVLKTFTVKLQHEVPPQHMIENSAGARILDSQQIAQFEKYGPLKRGTFAEDEDETIKSNWDTFCKVHNWDKNNVEPFLYMRHDGKYYIPDIEERKKFVRFLSNGLPWRSLYSVHCRFRNLYTIVNNGPYTEEEDEKILSYMKKEPNQCAELARLLNRKRQSIWTRYQKLKEQHNLPSTSAKKKSKKKSKSMTKKTINPIKRFLTKTAPKQIFTDIRWTSPLVKKFIDSIVEVTNCKELVNLKNVKIEKVVWKMMEKKMSISRTALQNFWNLQLHMQLFCPAPIYLNDTKVKLIEHMYTEKLENLEEINWERICVHFNGITPSFLKRLFEQLLNCAKKHVETSDLNDALEFLHKTYMPILIEKSVDAVLPKLFYHDGKIICIDKGSEKKIPNKFTTNPFCDEDES